MILIKARRAALMVLLVAVAASCATGQGVPAPQVLGRPAPDFTASRLDGGAFRLSSLRGRVVVLDVWAAWCVGCEKDLPLLDEMAIRLSDSDVEVVAVSLDEERARLEPIVASRSWRMTVLHDPSGRVGDIYQPSKMPAVFIIDREGTVRSARFGLEGSEIAAVEAEARALSR